LRARREMLGDLLTVDDGMHVREVVARHVASTALPALALFVPRAARSAGAAGSSAAMEDAIEILRVCQTAADETTTLTRVCEQVQRHMRAAACAMFGIESGTLSRLASRGARSDTATVE